MDSKLRGATFALKRSQAQRNCEDKVAKILYGTVKTIALLSKAYRVGTGKLNDEHSLRQQAYAIVEGCAESISSYTQSYSEAAYSILGMTKKSLGEFMKKDFYGKTFAERNTTYLRFFADDIVNMIKAGAIMGYSHSKILSALRVSYKDPYQTSIITKIQRTSTDIPTASYGKGIFRSAYANIIRNVKQTISRAWGMAEQEYGAEEGYTTFRVFRGSSYPCPVCDNECSYIHHIGQDPFPPFHISCVCQVQFVTDE